MSLLLGKLSRTLRPMNRLAAKRMFLQTIRFHESYDSVAEPNDSLVFSQEKLDLSKARLWAWKNVETQAQEDVDLILDMFQREVPEDTMESVVFYRNMIPVIQIRQPNCRGFIITFDMNEFCFALEEQKETDWIKFGLCTLAGGFVFLSMKN